MPVKIVTDSTSDLPPELAKELGITVIPLYLRFGEKSYRDGVEITPDEFYEKLVSEHVSPTTSQPTPSDFARVYQQLSKETDEIVSIHLSSKLSGTYNSALQGKKLADTKSNITIVDSESVTIGLGIIAISAARLALVNESLAKILEDVKQSIKNTHMMGTFDTLKYLALGGRIGKAKALLGSMLNVKPILAMREGELVPVGNVRTRTKSIEKLVDFAKNALNTRELGVVYSTTHDEAHGLIDSFSSLVNKGHLHLARLGPALGIHGGPGMLAVAFKGELPESTPTSLADRINVPQVHLPKLNVPNLPHLPHLPHR